MRLSYGVNNKYPDDIYIVSYPRSGNTWTRYIMAYLKAGTLKPLTSIEVDRYVPDIYANATNANLDTSRRVIKTH